MHLFQCMLLKALCLDASSIAGPRNIPLAISVAFSACHQKERGWMQARVEEVGQALLRRTQDVGGLGPRRKGKRNQHHTDAYEEHMLLPEVCSSDITPCNACSFMQCMRSPCRLHVLVCRHLSSIRAAYFPFCLIAGFLLAFALLLSLEKACEDVF